MYLIDTHAHLDMIKWMAPAEAVRRSVEEGVKYIINPGSSIEGSKKAVEYATKFPGVFASVGLHPNHAEEAGTSEIGLLESLMTGSDGKRNKKVVAVGEVGFDFYRDLSSRINQEKAFRAQIELALRYNLPLIIHNRDADKQIFRVLKEFSGHDNLRGVVHCFLSDSAFAMQCLDLGLYISFTGIITFPSAKNTLNAVKSVPIDRMFVETDAPFLAPQAKRGKENFPGYVKYVAEKIAKTKEMALEEVAEITSENAVKFFKLTVENN